MSQTEPFPEALRAALHEWVKVFMRHSMHDFKTFMDQAGLSMTQVDTLMRLHRHGGCGVSDSGEQVGITNAAASQMIERLVQMRLLERSEDPNDRRVKQLNLTPAGQTLIAQGIAVRQQWLESLIANLPSEQQHAITKALVTLTEAAKKLEAR